MEVIVAKTAGFCFGVKKAMDRVYEQAEFAKDRPIYTFGPIIHNEEVVKDLSQKGIGVINSEEELEQIKKGTVIIRSHGVPKKIYDILEKKGLEVVDATCPFVKKIHNIAAEESKAGKTIVIIGDDKHPEVEGIMGWCETKPITVKTIEDADSLTLDKEKQLCIVAQTTFNYKKFKDIVENISKKGYDINVLNTICNATHERQEEAQQIAKGVDAMIVIGGRHSSNTQKLFEICKKECENTYYIQTLDDLDFKNLESMKYVGITAGASTPNNIIREVQSNVRTKF